MTNQGKPEIEINFAGTKLVLDAAGILYFPDISALLVSDLHFEKGSFFAAKRNPVPTYDTLETLENLEKVIKKYTPKQVICLGDSFHDFKAETRIDMSDAERLNGMSSNCTWVWVLGNHDKNFPKNIHGRQVEELKLRNINLSHEKTGAEFEIIGHFHPKARVTIQEHYIHGKAFIYDQNLLIMPSFGVYTGGLYTDAPEITSLFSNRPKQYMIYNKKLWKL
jgi:uncharacterized protein